MGRSSAAAKARRKSKLGEGGASNGKRGNKGHFHGSRAAFIAEYFPEFVVAKAAGRGAQKKFWDAFYGAWWQQFHWKLPLNQEPGEETTPTLPQPEDETEEELAEKSVVVDLTQKVCFTVFFGENPSDRS